MLAQSETPYIDWVIDLIPRRKTPTGEHFTYEVRKPGFDQTFPQYWGVWLGAAIRVSSNLIGARWAGAEPEIHMKPSRMLHKEVISAIEFMPGTIIHLWYNNKHFVFHCPDDEDAFAEVPEEEKELLHALRGFMGGTGR